MSVHHQTIYPLSPGQASGDRPLIGRFAPSPTGRMHAGNIFSALVCWILCKRSGGEVLLRIEDLDCARSKQEYVTQVMRDFESFGLTWDKEPLYQSKRQPVYLEVFRELQGRGLTYPCFCTRADLHAASAPHLGEKPVYTQRCKNLSAQQLSIKNEAVQKQGRHPSQRLIVPDESYCLNDVFQGKYCQNLAFECGDFIIRRSDLSFAYQLAVVVDDSDQGVNCIVRGVDLLSSTPQQLFLCHLLNLQEPIYAHVPLLMGNDGHRLSKRHADADAEYLVDAFGSTQAVLGHIAYTTGILDDDVPVTAQDLLDYADLTKLFSKREITWTA